MAEIREQERVEVRQSYRLADRRISWGSVIAGGVVTVAVQLILGLLGVGVGAASFDAGGSAGVVGIGTGIWLTIAGFISLFCGGWVAGRLSGIPRKTESILHGVMTWAATTVFMIFMVTSTISGLFGGVTSLLGQSIQMDAQSIPEIVSDARESLQSGAVEQAGQQVSPAEAGAMAQEGAGGVAGSTLLACFVLLIGCGAAALGGFYATPKNTVLENLPTFERRVR